MNPAFFQKDKVKCSCFSPHIPSYPHPPIKTKTYYHSQNSVHLKISLSNPKNTYSHNLHKNQRISLKKQKKSIHFETKEPTQCVQRQNENPKNIHRQSEVNGLAQMKHEYVYVPCRKKQWSQYIKAQQKEKEKKGMQYRIKKNEKKRKTLEECFEFRKVESVDQETENEISYVVDKQNWNISFKNVETHQTLSSSFHEK